MLGFCLSGSKLRMLTAVLLLAGLLWQMPAGAKEIDWQKKLESGYREMSLGNVDKAADVFRDKVRHYPDSGACHTALGIALKKKGQRAEAKAEFTTATRVEPAYADGFYELGAMLENDKDYSGAAGAFEKYLQLAPGSNRAATVAERVRFCKGQLQ